jgi:hypothetical protein
VKLARVCRKPRPLKRPQAADKIQYDGEPGDEFYVWQSGHNNLYTHDIPSVFLMLAGPPPQFNPPISVCHNTHLTTQLTDNTHHFLYSQLSDSRPDVEMPW